MPELRVGEIVDDIPPNRSFSARVGVIPVVTIRYRGVWRRGPVLKVEADLLMCPAVGTGARVLVHETLTVFTAHLWTLLGWNWLSLLLRSISRHRLAIPWTHRHPIPGIRIVRRPRSITAVPLLNGIPTWLRHVPWHSLWHTSRGDECNLCLATHVRPTLALQNHFETILHCGSTSSGPTGRYPNAQWKSLSWTLTKV